jgi:hypothetical protein
MPCCELIKNDAQKETVASAENQGKSNQFAFWQGRRTTASPPAQSGRTVRGRTSD